MAPSDFDELITEMEEAGLDDSYIDRLRKASDGSPLRRENAEIRKQAEAALAQANTYKGLVANAQFRELGINIKPEALRTPDDLDWTDQSKVRDWAVSSGLLAPPEPEPDATAEVEGHDRINNAVTGAQTARNGTITPDIAAEWDAGKWKRFAKQHPVEADALMQGQQVTGVTF